MIDGLKQITYYDKEFIFHEGDKGELFYIIEVGQVECGIEDDDGFFDITRELSQGDHFGEISLINNVKRTLSVRSKGETTLLSLSKNAFNRICGSIKLSLKLDYKTVINKVDSPICQTSTD